MADKKTEKRGFQPSKFQLIGKYFLITVILLGQIAIIYSIISNNYEAIYSYVQTVIPEEVAEHELGELIVNPAQTNGHRYLLVKLSLELVDGDAVEAVTSHRSKVRNNLIEYLSAQPVSELQGPKDKENLRLELVKIINNSIGQRSVRNLYYSKYVMQ